MAHPSLTGCWADEPSTLCPEMVRVDLEHQVETLTKKLADAENMLTAGRSRRRFPQVDKDALENSRALSLSRKHCVTRIRELLTEEETHSWSKNTESLIAMLSSTTKLYLNIYHNVQTYNRVQKQLLELVKIYRIVLSAPAHRQVKSGSVYWVSSHHIPSDPTRF